MTELDNEMIRQYLKKNLTIETSSFNGFSGFTIIVSLRLEGEDISTQIVEIENEK